MISSSPRGADLLMQALQAAGVRHVFTLSGNHIMSVFDAALDTEVRLVHVRHEAAAVHMADAWGRLTGQPGIALVTAAPGFANCLTALYVARTSESPCILLSGTVPEESRGRGPFQEMPQAEMARPVTKASWTVPRGALLPAALRKAWDVAVSGRPGPVHLALPADVLDEAVGDMSIEPVAESSAAAPSVGVLEAAATRLGEARRPLVLAGPAWIRGARRQMLSDFTLRTHIPAVAMESPRGVNDPGLGAIAEVLPQADCVLLLDKKLDFTLRLRGEFPFSDDCRFLQWDCDTEPLDLTRRVLASPDHLLLSESAATDQACRLLTHRLAASGDRHTGWQKEVVEAVGYRPAEWQKISTSPGEPLHPVEVCRAVQAYLAEDPEAVFVTDGGEFGQWTQACIQVPHRLINGPGGSIGSVIPFALAARLAFPNSRVVAAMGDGTFGFHAMEFDTAVRYDLPFIAVVGNDALWNAEYQIQLRQYGPQRAVGCQLQPARYDQMASALGGYGRSITRAAELNAALADSGATGLPACLNVSLQSAAAPIIRRRG